jgi:hypothetical protein
LNAYIVGIRRHVDKQATASAAVRGAKEEKEWLRAMMAIAEREQAWCSIHDRDAPQ